MASSATPWTAVCLCGVVMVSLRESPASTKCSSIHGQVKSPPQDCQARGTHEWTHTRLIYIHGLQYIAYSLLSTGVAAAAAATHKNTVQRWRPGLQDTAKNVLLLPVKNIYEHQWGFIYLLWFSARSQSETHSETLSLLTQWGKILPQWWHTDQGSVLHLSAPHTGRHNQEQTTTRNTHTSAWDTPHHCSTTLGLRISVCVVEPGAFEYNWWTSTYTSFCRYCLLPYNHRHCFVSLGNLKLL